MVPICTVKCKPFRDPLDSIEDIHSTRCVQRLGDQSHNTWNNHSKYAGNKNAERWYIMCTGNSIKKPCALPKANGFLICYIQIYPLLRTHHLWLEFWTFTIHMKQGLKVVKRWLGSCKALDETNMSGLPCGGKWIAMIRLDGSRFVSGQGCKGSSRWTWVATLKALKHAFQAFSTLKAA